MRVHDIFTLIQANETELQPPKWSVYTTIWSVYSNIRSVYSNVRSVYSTFRVRELRVLPVYSVYSVHVVRVLPVYSVYSPCVVRELRELSVYFPCTPCTSDRVGQNHNYVIQNYNWVMIIFIYKKSRGIPQRTYKNLHVYIYIYIYIEKKINIYTSTI